jgi:HEPN domain-containing protein
MSIDNELAMEFLRKAEHDLGSARLLLTGDNLFDSVCFHCQQLAEKSIKAVLTHKSIRFKKIHDLDVLLSLLDDPEFNSVRSYALILNSYAVDARYPGDYVEPVQEEAEEALRMAIEIYELVKKKLGI